MIGRLCLIPVACLALFASLVALRVTAVVVPKVVCTVVPAVVRTVVPIVVHIVTQATASNAD